MHGLLKHPDSPYIRAILSLRRIGTISRLLRHSYSGVEKERGCNSTRVLVLILNLMSTQPIMQ
ncbi:hypothetical protein V6Z11_A08G179500 [Gossypium hirsutum]